MLFSQTLESFAQLAKTISNLAKSPSDHLISTSIFCLWLSTHKCYFTSYLAYGKLLHLSSKTFESTLILWLHALVGFVNIISSFADIEMEDVTLCNLDSHIFGLKAFQEAFTARDKGDLAREGTTMILYSRIGNLALNLSIDESFEFLVFDNTLFLFVVRDEAAKRKEMQRVMKVLATERLKEQVSTLETRYGSFMDFSHPVFLVETSVILRLNLLKSWLMKRCCTIIVCQDGKFYGYLFVVIRNLDFLKKGGNVVSQQARESIRYLEQRFRYPSPYLYGEMPEQETRASRPDLEIPTMFSSILGACETFKGISDQRDGDGKFYLVSDNEELAELAQKLGFETLSSKEWGQLGRF